jgi:hypothetical protein
MWSSSKFIALNRQLYSFAPLEIAGHLAARHGEIAPFSRFSIVEREIGA